jgi:hypothetical protein
MSRDPRRDPKAGDIVENGSNRFYVMSVDRGVVSYTESPPPDVLTVDIDEWRTDAINDVIIKAAE